MIYTYDDWQMELDRLQAESKPTNLNIGTKPVTEIKSGGMPGGGGSGGGTKIRYKKFQFNKSAIGIHQITNKKRIFNKGQIVHAIQIDDINMKTKKGFVFDKNLVEELLPNLYLIPERHQALGNTFFIENNNTWF